VVVVVPKPLSVSVHEPAVGVAIELTVNVVPVEPLLDVTFARNALHALGTLARMALPKEPVYPAWLTVNWNVDPGAGVAPPLGA